MCEEVECGKGNCTAGPSYPMGFKCECESGWKRTRDDDEDVPFLPCVIPNCKLVISTANIVAARKHLINCFTLVSACMLTAC